MNSLIAAGRHQQTAMKGKTLSVMCSSWLKTAFIPRQMSDMNSHSASIITPKVDRHERETKYMLQNRPLTKPASWFENDLHIFSYTQSEINLRKLCPIGK